MSFTVLYVCTGNVCRSPMAELSLRAGLASEPDVVVGSAGTHALVGHGVDTSSAAALALLGLDPSRHRARQFEAWMAARADLILTAERVHRDIVMTECPAAFRRTFTMKEFARLAGLHHLAGPRGQVVAGLAARRGVGGPVTEDEDTIPDPYLADLDRAQAVAAQVIDTVHATIAVVRRAKPVTAGRTSTPSLRVRPRPRPRPQPDSRPRPTR